jgi:hypothetical protein
MRNKIIDRLIAWLVVKQPQLAQEISDKIAWNIQDNELLEAQNRRKNNASKI